MKSRENVLITGVAGNIGSYLAKKIISEDNFNLVGVDDLSTGSANKLPSLCDTFNFIKINVNKFDEISSIFDAYKFDYVFHFAAMVGIERVKANPIKVFDDIDGIKNILNLSENQKVKRVFFSSSSEIYGEPISLPQNEEKSPLDCKLPYPVVKNVGEILLKAYFDKFGLNYTIFRFFNTYGPNQSEDFVIPNFLRNAKSNLPIYIYGDGSQTRTFCYVDDNIDTIYKCLTQNVGNLETINVGSNIETSILELARLIIKITNSKSEIIFLKPSSKRYDQFRRKPDIEKMQNILQRGLISLEEGLKKLLLHMNK